MDPHTSPEPVFRVTLPPDIRTWVIRDPDISRRFLRSPLLRKHHSYWGDLAEGRLKQSSLVMITCLETMLSTDDAPPNLPEGQDRPEGTHRRLRAPAAAAFTRTRMNALRPAIVQAAEELLDEIEADVAPGEKIDLRACYALRLPLGVFCTLLGVDDPADRAALADYARAMLDTRATPEEQADTWRGIYTVMTRLVNFKRNNPGTDLMTDLILALDRGQFHSIKELLDTAMVIAVGGFETIANVITNGALALLNHPHQLRLLLNGECTWQKAVSEILRWIPPVRMLFGYFAAEDFPIGDTRIRRGDAVTIDVEAIGHDKGVHGDTAEDFDITRESHEHLAFSYHAHRCVGAPLGELESEIALELLFQRFPNMTLATDPGEIRRTGAFTQNSLQFLHVRPIEAKGPLFEKLTPN